MWLLLNSNRKVMRAVITKNVSDSYCIITPSELKNNIFILDVNIARTPLYNYCFVEGHGVNGNGDLFVYFNDKFTANNVMIMVHYANI